MCEVAAWVPVGHMRSDVFLAKRPPGDSADPRGE